MKYGLLLLLFFSSCSSFLTGQKNQLAYQLVLFKGLPDDVMLFAERVETDHPEWELNLQFDTPNLKLVLGNCDTEKAIKKLKKKWSADYPDAFIEPCPSPRSD